MPRKELVPSASRDPHLLEQDSNGIQNLFPSLQITVDAVLFVTLMIFVFYIRCHYLRTSVLMRLHQAMMSVNSWCRSSDPQFPIRPWLC
jgi:hypothetical protein